MDSRDKTITELRAVIERMAARIAELELQLAKAKKDSSTSSKPPSSDMVRPKSKARKSSRKKPRQGGQPGHERKLRQPLPVDRVDEVVDYYGGNEDSHFSRQKHTVYRDARNSS
jgi:hypothetical protein